ncbi:hypothetical protein ACFYM3_34805 [Streptomyces massasporeus]|uniref:Uncharacterized protein n=1 Tax=Streptomyces massasporeus TaxID=67324 RepID=A0ABW6LPX1_9ACTN
MGGPVRIRLTRDRQQQMQHALHGKAASHNDGQRQPPTDCRPDDGELRPRHQQHEPPRHRFLSDSTVPQSGEDAAGQGEHPGPGTD